MQEELVTSSRKGLDQLVKELRLAGISSIAQANRFLDGGFMNYYNQRYALTENSKSVNARVDNAIKKQHRHPIWKPPPDHPWRHMKINIAPPETSPKGTFQKNSKEDISI